MGGRAHLSDTKHGHGAGGPAGSIYLLSAVFSLYSSIGTSPHPSTGSSLHWLTNCHWVRICVVSYEHSRPYLPIFIMEISLRPFSYLSLPLKQKWREGIDWLIYANGDRVKLSRSSINLLLANKRSSENLLFDYYTSNVHILHETETSHQMKSCILSIDRSIAWEVKFHAIWWATTRKSTRVLSIVHLNYNCALHYL